MRIRPTGDNPIERLALALNLAPLPAGYALYGMTAGRVVGVAQRLGVFTQLLSEPRSVAELAQRLELQLAGARLLCECLAGLELLEQDGERFALARSARKWLDPASPTYVGTWIEHSVSYWEWYGSLERIVKDGGSFEIHAGHEGEHEYWRIYITGQYELARLSADEVARRVRVPQRAGSLLDVAGGHGWFAAALCKRHQGLSATVLDLPDSCAVGREIIASAGMEQRVAHREGDMFEADLGGPHDVALLFDIVHHLSGEQLSALLHRVRASLRPGATIAVLDLFRGGRSRQSASAATLGMLFLLTSGGDLPDPDDLATRLRDAGFGDVRRTPLRRIPDQALYQATAV
jgi:2-polyprenyl-3-methyl-5-hydroxy-6-metoxy-1,4-benzoquinol methylase